MTNPTPYQVKFLNIGPLMPYGNFRDLSSALCAAKVTGFECVVHFESKLVAAWSPLYGVKHYF